MDPDNHPGNRSNRQDTAPKADHVFEGGSMDCGSGLVLLIRQHMMKVPIGGVLEIRSTEPTVTTELPPWCRLAGHHHVLSDQVQPGQWHHLVRRGDGSSEQSESLESDKSTAKQFQWNLRARRAESGDNSIYSRNLSWHSGMSLSFERKGELPTALEQMLGALLGDVLACFADRCQRVSIVLDELEATINARLANPLAAIGLEPGNPAVQEIKLVVYATSGASADETKRAWDNALAGSPVFATLDRSCQIETRLALM